MRFCPACGASNEDGARFCVRCGGEIATAGSPTAGRVPGPARARRFPLKALLAIALAAALGLGGWFGYRALFPGGPGDAGWTIVSPEWGGDEGSRIMRTTDAGQTWDGQYESDDWLLTVAYPDEQTCWAFGIGRDGESSIILRTTDGGDGWDEVDPPRGSRGCISGSFVDADTGWVLAVGDSYMYPGAIYRTTDGGDSWDLQYELGPKELEEWDAYLGTPFFLDDETGWVPMTTEKDDGFAASLLATTDGGESWDAVDLGVGIHPLTVHFENESTGYVVALAFGSSGGSSEREMVVLRTDDGGDTWETERTGAPAEYVMEEATLGAYHAAFVDDAIQVPGCSDSAQGRVAGSDDNGRSWRVTDVSMRPLATTFADEDSGWLVGMDRDGGTTLMYTTDGGESWDEADVKGE